MYTDKAWNAFIDQCFVLLSYHTVKIRNKVFFQTVDRLQTDPPIQFSAAGAISLSESWSHYLFSLDFLIRLMYKFLFCMTNNNFGMLFYNCLFSCLQCDSPYIITFFSAFFLENRISICTEFMDGEFLCGWSQLGKSFFFFFASHRRDFGELSSVSLPCIHLHFCRSTERLIAVSCLACLCAKSYKGVINLDLSAFVGAFVYACLDWCEMGDCVCWKVCVFVRVCFNVAIPLSHTFGSLSTEPV